MDTSQFAGQVKTIPIDSIEVNPQNPRGPFDTAKDPSFERLVSSVKQIGVSLTSKALSFEKPCFISI
jgi:hypothetical protein